jgi:hypothetical protein
MNPLKQESIVELWKPCVGLEEDYSISNFGRVRRERKRRGAVVGGILKPFPDHAGYLFVNLRKDFAYQRWFIHRLVAFAFHGKPAPKQVVNHKDGDPLNNRPENLEWCSQKENVQHALHILGTFHRGERSGLAKLRDKDIPVIRKMLSQKIPQRNIAATFGVSQSAIAQLKSGTTWKHI